MRTSQADFRHYVEKQWPAVETQIVGWDISHPARGEIVNMVRELFVKRGELVARPRMT